MRYIYGTKGPLWRNGRRIGFKIQGLVKGRVGSSPTSGTKPLIFPSFLGFGEPFSEAGI
jgi:hypothetical protein